MDDDEHAGAHPDDAGRDKCDAGQHLMPGKVYDAIPWTRRQRGWDEADQYQSGQGEKQIAHEPEQVGCAARR